MLNMSNNMTGAADPAVKSSTAAEPILTRWQERMTSAGTDARPQDDHRQCPSEQLAKLLLDAQAEYDRLHRITRRAGFSIVFRAPSGALIDHATHEPGTASKPQARGGLTPSALRKVREYVEANLEFKIELADLAAIGNLSRCHFACAFKQSLGCTPHRYVISRRLEKARQLLCESALPVAEIALATGFADQSHFSRCFRSFFAISPLAYRRSRS
jgi:transcriptional regulator GlxA family with amidase domain